MTTSASAAQPPALAAAPPFPFAGVDAGQTSAPSANKQQESGVVTRSVMRGTIPRNKLKPFVFLVRSLCPETGQTIEFREYDRVYNPSPEARGAPRNSIRLRTRIPATRSPSPGPGPTSGSASGSAPASGTGAAAGVGVPSSTPSAGGGGGGAANSAGTAASAGSGGAVGGGTASVSGSGGGSGNSSSSSSSSGTISSSGQWLLYAGLPNRRAPPSIDQRPVTTVAVRDAEPLLAILGCALAFEYVRKVIRYKTRLGLYIDVFLIERLNTPGDPSSTVALPQASADPREQHCVVELWADDLTSLEPLMQFSKYLSPYVAAFA